MMKRFARIVGLRRLKAIHLNDSKTELGSRKDRHESLGKGEIPKKAFKLIMQDKRLAGVPKILETPDPELYEKEIKMLKLKDQYLETPSYLKVKRKQLKNLLK